MRCETAWHGTGRTQKVTRSNEAHRCPDAAFTSGPLFFLGSMKHLARARNDLFGASRHHFILNPPLSEAEVLAFEKLHAITLPDDYRHFVSHIGNGGARAVHGG